MGIKQRGPCIYYFDTSSKGQKNKRHHRYRADITVRGVRYRKRSKSTRYLTAWLRSMGARDV
jgi:hypothetical protein